MSEINESGVKKPTALAKPPFILHHSAPIKREWCQKMTSLAKPHRILHVNSRGKRASGPRTSHFALLEVRNLREFRSIRSPSLGFWKVSRGFGRCPVKVRNDVDSGGFVPLCVSCGRPFGVLWRVRIRMKLRGFW